MNPEELKRAVLEKRIEAQLKSRGSQQQLLIRQADRKQPLPLSFAQQRLWFLCQYDPAASLAYHLPVILRLSGQLDRQALTTSLNHLIARHESLRTRFAFIEGQPCQHIDPADIGFALSYHDLRQFDPALHDSRVAELADLEAQAPFDLAQGPLIRGQLLQLTNNEHVLLLTLHHIITDGWSIGVLVRELGDFYRSALDGHEVSLPSLPVQYADYAVWQHALLQEKQLQEKQSQEKQSQEKQSQEKQSPGTRLTEQRDFWRARLEGIPDLLELPTDRPRPAVQSYAGDHVAFHLNVSLLSSLKALGQRHHTTLFMTVLSAWSIVLARLTGQDDIVIGTPVANRPHYDLEGLIGFFVNTLALRVRFNDDLNVADLLAQVRKQALAAYAHQDLPFEQVVEALQPGRSLSYNPIFQVMLALNNTPAQTLTLPGLQLTSIEQKRRGAHFDLALSLSETETGLAGDLEYATDLFDSATVERMVGYLTNVLSAMVDDERQSISTLPMLPGSEQHQLLVDFNTTQVDFPQDALIHQLFEAQSARRPDAIAIIFEEQTLSYGELNRRANRLAHYLIAQGVRPDDRVAICLERSLEAVVGLLGILKAGGAYVPLDPAYPAERLAYMLEDSAPVVLLTQTTQAGKLERLSGTVPVIVLDTQNTLWERQPEHNPDAQVLGLTSRHLAYVIYTSGSTGQPKGVMVEHRSVNSLVINSAYAVVGENDCVSHCANIAFDASTWEIWATLLNGGRLHVISQSLLLNPVQFRDALFKEKVTVLWLTVGLFNEYIEILKPLLGQLRYLLIGGDVLNPSKIREVQLAGSRPATLINGYGPTETTTFATTYIIASPIDVTRSIPIGQPINNTRVYILDPYGQPVPLGVTGEIYIAGIGVARGYLNRPELTAERFLIDPFSSAPEARMYKTGDLGRWLPDGNIEYRGRNDFQVKLRGFRIELGELENQLRQCHGVRDAVVLARKDETEPKRLVAYLLAQTGIELIPAELRQQLAQHLPDYMLPSAFVTLDHFPLTPNGKLDRQALPAPDSSAVVSRDYEAPTGEAEIALAQIWQSLLKLNQVSRYDHFFELGGHSLMIVSLMEELRSIGWQLDARSVFASPVLIDMAQAIQRQSHTDTFVVPANLIPDDCTAITPDMLPLVSLSQSEIDSIMDTIPGGANNVQDIYPLSPLQAGILFHYLMQIRGDTYLLQSLLAFDSRHRLDSFLCALQQVIDRHDILRTAVYWQGLEKPVQVVWRQASLAINLFTPATESDIPAQLQAHTDPHQHRINLNQAPLFATDIAHDTVQDEWLLALRFHHLVSDHMTLELIFAEIALILQGNAEALPKALPYRNFIARTLNVPTEEHEAYFRSQLADIDEPTAPFGVLSIPHHDDHDDHDKPIAESRLLLDPALSEAIRTQARRLKVSPSVLFHTAWAQVLAQTSGRDDVVFGSVLLGRLQGGAGSDQILGMFINTLPVRVSLAERSVQAVIQATYHHLMTLLEHEQAPLALAQGCSGVAQSTPLFSALLNYRHSQPSDTNTANALWSGIRTLATKEQTNYPMTLSVDDFGTDFYLTAQTVASISPARVTHYLLTAISGLVNALTHHPQQLILDIPILPETERQQLLVDFNATQADFPQDALIHSLFEAQAANRPDAIAVVFEEQTLSYGELNHRANRLAHYLIALGVQPDDRVAICAERSLEMVVGLLGILKAGGAYVPLDPAYPAERLTYMLEDSAPVVLLVQTTQTGKLSGAVPVSVPVVALDVIALDIEGTLLAGQPGHNPDTQASGLTSRHLAYVIYTSGSTGQPKGVMVEHRSVNRLIINNDYADITADDCVAHCANTAFDASTWEIWSALLNGGRLHIVSSSVLFDPVQFRDSLIKGKISVLWLTIGLFNEYLEIIKPLFGQLRYLLTGGDVLDPSKIRNVQLAALQPAHLIHCYGPTETTTFATTYAIQSLVDINRSIPIGRPITNTQIYILDSRGRPVPIGVTGEIYIGGAGVARGYLNRPELTAERFLSDPFTPEPDERMYKTGDLGRWLPDGNIEYLGRNDLQVKLRGFRIELGEIEARLRQCHGVHDAVVIAREETENSAGQKRLVAYLLPQDGAELVPAELRRQLARHLADYMLPSAFVTLDVFPLTPNGKLDRQAFPAPDASAVVIRSYEAPDSDEEIMLAQIWQDLLGLEHVGRYDHFFELGGHSLMLVQLATRIQDEFLIDIPISSLFIFPQLAKQADIILTAQMDALGENEMESLENSLDLMSTEELMAILGGDSNK
ncbi:amino acid adenylation domain-containing protein [Xenorhabdus sp. Reich]|uniref:Amino acid adenylation domain-containing protein n=2 Tax=Xenorhabdus littoralis TaxID=2582835 RepID=A0ABU4SHN2_9GAMM|nr:amino acid adenylation domain-containing protein [Xenorhabdus sp. Reich]